MSKIEWTDKTWNPVTGCSKISEGCKNCYAERMSKRLSGRFGYPEDSPFKVTLHPDKLGEPLKWKKPQMIFVVSMGDLFHEEVPDEFIYNVFRTMAKAHWHTFQVLTKRPRRARNIISRIRGHFVDRLEHVWLGVTAENQEAANDRIPILLDIPAAKKFVSIEPMLGPIDLTLDGLIFEDCRCCYGSGSFRIDGPDVDICNNCQGSGKLNDSWIDWVIVGGETGPGARLMNSDWARSIRDQCKDAGVPFFFKQLSKKQPIPDDLMIKEFPD